MADLTLLRRREAKLQAYDIPGGFLAWETVPGTGRR